MTTPDCKQAPGQFRPRIDRNRCEGAGACAAACPVSVFTIGTLPQDQRAGLSLRGKVKGFVHRWRQALLAQPDACQACGLCVQACPEQAITLERVARP